MEAFDSWRARLSANLGVFVLLSGVVVLIGWQLDIGALKSLLPGLATMKANTALAFVFAGAALALAAFRRAPWLSRVPALAVGCMGAATLAQYLFGWDLRIDQALFDDLNNAPGSPFPGRMAVVTAINLTLLSAALVLLDLELNGRLRPSNWLALLIGANSFLAVLGYLYDADEFYRLALLTAVALPTALIMLLASVGLVLARPGALLRSIFAANPAGVVARRLLPAAFLLPPLLGWLRWQGELAGFYGTAFGLALFAGSNVAVFGVLIWRSCRAVQRVHEQQLALASISDWQLAILNSAELTVISTAPDGLIRTINIGAARRLGYAPEELIGKHTPALIHDAGEVGARARVLTAELGRPVKPGFEAFVAKAVQNGVDENDWTYVRKDGSRFPVRLTVTAMRNAQGDLTGFVGIGKDLSELKQAEDALRESEQRMRLITDNLPALVAYVDHDQRYRFANAQIGRTFGVDPASMIGRSMREVRGDEIYAQLRENIERALAGEPVSFEGTAPAQGRQFHFRSIYVPDVATEGGVRGFFAMTFDVTDLKSSELRLAASETRLRLITDNVPALISFIDRDRRFRFNNSTYEQWLRRPLSEITGKRLDEVYDAQVFGAIEPHLERAFTGETVTFELESGTSGRQVRCNYVPQRDPSGQIDGVYGLIYDITAEKQAEAQLRKLAQYDALTGLANRSRFQEKLAEAIARSKRGRPMGLAFLDLDRFKAINDAHGHHGGDLVLQEFARRLTGCVRSTDTVARLAGDEFVIILEPLAQASEAAGAASKIIEAMAEPLVLPTGSVQMSTSIGIAILRADETDGDALLHRADQMLYAAKAAGRGCQRVEA